MRCTSVMLLILLVLSGCATGESTLPGGLSAGASPADFGLDITVLAGDADEQARPIEQRTARYVLYPGGDLHFAVGPELTAADAPPYVRTLSPRIVEHLWQMSALQLQSGAATADVANVELVERVEGQLTHLLIVHANNDYWQIARASAVGEGERSPETDLVRTLAALAWASDEPDINVIRIPIRYDHGPDPYAQYRNPPANDAALMEDGRPLEGNGP